VDGAAEIRKVFDERNDGHLWKNFAHDRELSSVNFWLNQIVGYCLCWMLNVVKINICLNDE
jgi:hypothetical protein